MGGTKSEVGPIYRLDGEIIALARGARMHAVQSSKSELLSGTPA